MHPGWVSFAKIPQQLKCRPCNMRYKTSLYVAHFKRALNSGEAQHCEAQCSVPSAPFALESYGYEAPQAKAKLESCETWYDYQRCGKGCRAFRRA